jgi:isopentenyldiphosphate isomerase
MTSPRVAVVDENDRFVRWTDRTEIHRLRLIHRSIHVLVVDSRGRLVIQLRHRDKLTYAHHWDISCSGHVEEPDYLVGPDGIARPDDDLDRVYATCAARELEEELGVRAPLAALGHFLPERGVHYEQIRLFLARSDGPFTAQPEEIEDLRFVTHAELDALCGDASHREHPVTGSLRLLANVARERGWW